MKVVLSFLVMASLHFRILTKPVHLDFSSQQMEII